MPNALATLAYFEQARTPMFLVTGSSRNDIDYILEKTGIKKYFEFPIKRSDVEKSKPDPESYAKAIAKSGFKPEGLTVFEDTRWRNRCQISELKIFCDSKKKALCKKKVNGFR